MNRMVLIYFIRIIREYSARFQFFKRRSEKAKVIFMNFQFRQWICIKQNSINTLIGNLVNYFFPKSFKNFNGAGSFFTKLTCFFCNLVISFYNNVFCNIGPLNETRRNCHTKAEFKDNATFGSRYFGKLFHVWGFPIFHHRVPKNFQGVLIKNCRSIFPRLPILETYSNASLMSGVANITPRRRRRCEIFAPWKVGTARFYCSHNYCG